MGYTEDQNIWGSAACAFLQCVTLSEISQDKSSNKRYEQPARH